MSIQQPTLSPDLCRSRQNTLCELLEQQKLDGTLLTNRNYVHALTGYWHEQPLTQIAILIQRDGKAILFAPGEDPNAPAVDAFLSYEPQELCTLVENIPGRLAEAIKPCLNSSHKVGVSGETDKDQD